MDLCEVLCIFLAICLFLYYYSISNYDFWNIRSVKGPKPIPLFGNFKDLILNRLFIGDQAMKFYKEFQNEPMIGVFDRKTPILILRDSQLIKNVLIKDFDKFADRGFTINEKADPLSAHLFSLEPKRWRPLRRILSPTFTSGKIKEMFYLLSECSDHLEKYLEQLIIEKKEIECRQLTAKFTMDVIGSCAFGIDINALSDEKNDFFRMGKKIFDDGYWTLIRRKMRVIAPWLYSILSTFIADNEINNFFINLIKDTMQYRKDNNIVRHDFIDLLKQVKENPDKLGDIELTDSFIAAQVFIFFLAGFETSSSTMSNALYELALNPSIQDKLQMEIREESYETGGKLIYDRIKNMKYLHKVFLETLRKYPPLTVITRKSTEKYTFPGTKVVIPKNQSIWIPIYAIQRDPKNYPDPEIFDPERFDDEKVKLRNPMLFLSFGDGPRNCIGARFAVYQTKVGLIKILRNYKVEVCDKTPIPLVNNPAAFLLRPNDGIYLKFLKIK